MKKLYLLILLTIILINGCSAIINEINSANLKEVPLHCSTTNKKALEFFEKGQKYYAMGHVTPAINAYLVAFDNDTLFCDALTNIGLIYRYSGQLKKAIFYYQKSLSIDNTNPVVLQNLGFCFLISGQSKKSIAYYRVLIEYHPQNPEGYYGLGMALLEVGEYDIALINTLKSIELYKTQKIKIGSEVFLSLGRNYFYTKDYKKAIQIIDDVYSDYYMNPDVNYLFASCYHNLDKPDTENAEKYFRRAQDLGYELADEIKSIYDL